VKAFLGIAALVMGISSGVASAAVVVSSIGFTTPNLTVAPGDSIDIMVTMTLDSSSEPLKSDAVGYVPLGSGFDRSDINAGNLFGGLPSGVDPTTDPLEGLINNSFGCFGTVCSGYNFNFNFNISTTSHPNPTDTLYDARNLDVEPGDTITWTYGSLTPLGGSAPPGVYTLTSASFFVQVFDENFLQDPSNAFSGPLHIADVTIGDAGSSGPLSITVVGPEPATWVLMLAGLALAAGCARRNSRRHA
jgi:PEP-CTERM motif-containing protein